MDIVITKIGQIKKEEILNIGVKYHVQVVHFVDFCEIL